MSSTNGSGRPTGSVTIPVEIIRDSNSTGPKSHSRQNSPYRTIFNDNPYSGFSDSSPRGSSSNGRFQPRHSPNTAYDRVIHNSQFNQPTHDYPSYPQYQDSQFRHSPSRMYDSNLSQLRRSHEDLLSTPFESLHTNPQPFTSFTQQFGTGFPSDSDFIQPMRFSSPNRRSFDALNEFPDMHQSFPSTRQYPPEQPPPQQQQQQQQQQQPYYRTTYQTQHQPQSQQQQQQQQQQPNYGNQSFYNPNIVYTDEYGQPADHYQQNTFQGSSNNAAHDRPRSPASKRGASPAQPSPTPQDQEPELKMASDSDGPIPMPGPSSSANSTSAPTTQPTEPQVSTAEAKAPTMNTASPPPEPVRDPNTIALEKLEQMKQMLDTLEKDVDAFNGSTRNDLAYKVLDENAVKIMIRCDELVDVSADIKEKRKEMIRNVQRIIGKLESKVPGTPAVQQNSNPMETAIVHPTESYVTRNEASSPSNSQNTAATEQSIPS